MNTQEPFPATLAAAHERIAALRVAEYARTRNALDGAVTRLSPYITHGFVSLPEVLAGVAGRAVPQRLSLQHKFVFELGWREFFQHLWQHRGSGILADTHPGPLPAQAYTRELPADIRQARTGVPVVDQAVRELYATGYLHNHARMWLASYVVHLRKVHWRAGADWMLAHLLDGDLASNHLSWQWVAGTGSAKPYLFNADNVARHAPTVWHSPGSVVDASYETLEARARTPEPVPAQPVGEGVEEPLVYTEPPLPLQANGSTLASELSERDVWIVHPWALGALPADLPAGCRTLAWWPAEHHEAWPWSAARWRFVGTRMAELDGPPWLGNQRQLAQALSTARSVQTLGNGHVMAWLPACVTVRPAPRLFAEVDRPCPSFFAWWKRATQGMRSLSDLPGLQTLELSAATPP
ncbi:FAD-binding domain-containing protein [Inhella sp.]|uniref:FAD-binding domain-containing protein n=1 Tax=Inhella sp. TaxID=1921806 RepID=UPI0035B02E4B